MPDTKTTTKPKVMTWEDEHVRGGSRKERPDTYKGKSNRRDRIRIVCGPVLYGAANVQLLIRDEKTREVSETGFKAPSRCTGDTLYAAIVSPKDDAALQAAQKACPLFKRGYNVKDRYAVLLHHISSEVRKGKSKTVDAFIVADWPAGTYEMLRNIAQTLPTRKTKDGEKRKMRLHEIELIVSCSDDTFQKLTFVPITDRAELTHTFAESKQMAIEAGCFENDEFGAGNVSDIVELIEPDSARDLTESLDRAEKSYEEFGDESGDEDDDDEGDRKKRRAKPDRSESRKPKPKDADEDDDLFDDDDEESSDAESDDEEADDSDEEEVEEERPKRKPGKKPVKPVGKKPKRESEDDEDIAREVDEMLDDDDVD